MKLDFVGKLAPYLLGVLAGVLFTTADFYFGGLITLGYAAWFLRDLWLSKARGN